MCGIKRKIGALLPQVHKALLSRRIQERAKVKVLVEGHDNENDSRCWCFLERRCKLVGLSKGKSGEVESLCCSDIGQRISRESVKV